MTADFPRLSTGLPELDEILDGGIPAQSVILITGAPGTGQTVLVLWLLFHWARQGKRSIFFTTLGEPAIKLLRYIQLFEFFDQGLIDSGAIRFRDLSSRLTDEGPEAVLDEVRAEIERTEPEVVVIDSFKAINELISAAGDHSNYMYRLAVSLAGWGATTFLTGTYAEEEALTAPEFAVADGFLHFSNESLGLARARQLEVLKLRMSSPVLGRHFFEISPAGISIFPRLRPPRSFEHEPRGEPEPVATGVPGLDILFGEGVPRESSTIVEGAREPERRLSR